MDQFLAVADPTRRQIIESLLGGERSFGDIAGQFAMSQPAVSQHLRVLRHAGVVTVRRDAQRRLYSLRRDGLADVDDWLSGVRRFWAARLDELQAELEKPNS